MRPSVPEWLNPWVAPSDSSAGRTRRSSCGGRGCGEGTSRQTAIAALLDQRAITSLRIGERIDSHAVRVSLDGTALVERGESGGVESPEPGIAGKPACVAPTHEAHAHARTAPAAPPPRAHVPRVRSGLAGRT